MYIKGGSKNFYPFSIGMLEFRLLICSMEQSVSLEANRFSASQNIFCVLWNSNVYYRVYNWSRPAPILSQINPIQAPPHTSWRSILMLSHHQCFGLPSGLFPAVFPTKTRYAPLLSPIGLLATCLAHLILLDLITRIIFDEARLKLRLISVTESYTNNSVSLNGWVSHRRACV
jgi:hypothetical protein